MKAGQVERGRGHGREELRETRLAEAPEEIRRSWPWARTVGRVTRRATCAGYTKIAETIRGIEYDLSLLMDILGLERAA